MININTKMFDMEVNPINLIKILLCCAIIINLFTKFSKQFTLNNVSLIIWVCIVILALFINTQLSFLLFVFLLTVLYNNSLKNVSFDLNHSVWYYNKNDSLEKFDNKKVNGNDDHEDNEENEEGNDNEENEENKPNELLLSVNNNKKNNSNMMNENSTTKNVDYDPEKNTNNSEEVVENFEEPVDIKMKLKEIEEAQQQQITKNVPITVKTEAVDLDSYISNAIYVPFEKLDSIQNNMISSVKTDLTQLDNSIDEDYYHSMSNNREKFVEKYIN